MMVFCSSSSSTLTLYKIHILVFSVCSLWNKVARTKRSRSKKKKHEEWGKQRYKTNILQVHVCIKSTLIFKSTQRQQYEYCEAVFFFISLLFLNHKIFFILFSFFKTNMIADPLNFHLFLKKRKSSFALYFLDAKQKSYSRVPPSTEHRLCVWDEANMQFLKHSFYFTTLILYAFSLFLLLFFHTYFLLLA